ncbi:MAG TPA: hypothetical protein VLH09_02910 [Bryobacteraceae bacterium]|nr:hypothetical protein [Bryobacteraceae bacterium]
MGRIVPFLISACLLAAQAGPLSVRIRVPAWAGPAAENGRTALSAADVSASLGGKSVGVSRVLGPSDDLMLLLVADVSEDLTLVHEAGAALVERIHDLPPNVSVGLLRAQDGLRVLADPTPDRELIATAIGALPVSGRAGLLESLQAAASVGDAVLSKAAIRLAVLYLTDSDVRNYREDFTNPVINESDRRDMSRRFPDALIRERISKLETALARLQTPIFILHLNYRSQGLNEAYQAGLMRLASITGGTSLFCRSQAEIPDATGKILDAILAHYSIEVELPPDAPATLGIVLESPGRTLNYRSQFTR